MRIAKDDIPARIDIPGAKARHLGDFGDAKGFDKMAGEYFSLGEGVDFAPLLQGLEGDLCQCPHWGYLLEGRMAVKYSDGSIETVNGGDIFYWPPGHTIKVEQAAEIILFSPEHEHAKVMDHVSSKLKG